MSAIVRPDWGATPPAEVTPGGSNLAAPSAFPNDKPGTERVSSQIATKPQAGRVSHPDWNVEPPGRTESQRILDEIERPFVNDGDKPAVDAVADDDRSYPDGDVPASPERYDLTRVPLFRAEDMEPAQNFLKVAHAAGMGQQRVHDAVTFVNTYHAAPGASPEAFFHAAIEKAIGKGWNGDHIATALEHMADEAGRIHGAQARQQFLAALDAAISTYKPKGR